MGEENEGPAKVEEILATQPIDKVSIEDSDKITFQEDLANLNNPPQPEQKQEVASSVSKKRSLLDMFRNQEFIKKFNNQQQAMEIKYGTEEFEVDPAQVNTRKN